MKKQRANSNSRALLQVGVHFSVCNSIMADRSSPTVANKEAVENTLF